jgi:hypothetical protein
MQLIEVVDKKTEEAFLKVPKLLYKGDRNWTCPLDIEIKGIFNPTHNTCFNNGKAIRWILKDNNKLIGRMAAFIDNSKTDNYYVKTGGIGFFECINNQEAANLLFDAGKNWLQESGMEGMLGPINFGENYTYWGLLTENYTTQGYGMPYNFPYYKELFENYGFKNFFEQYSYHRKMHIPYPERMLKFAEYIASRAEYSFEHFSYAKQDKYVEDLTTIYNSVWSTFHEGYKPLKAEEIHKLINESKALLDEQMIWFAYHNNKPIGLVVAFPDANQILRKLKNGKLNLINKLKFLYHKKSGAINRSRAFIFGIAPEYQNKGVLTGLFLMYVRALEKKGFKEIELSWVGDYNPRMLKIYDTINAEKAKTHITYLKIFDPNFEFKRFTNEFEGKKY